MIGVVAPLKTEISALLKSLPIQKKGRFYETPNAVFIHSGVGRSHARRAAEALLLRYPDLTGMICTGFAGSLTEDLTTGDLVVGGAVGDEGRIPPWPDVRGLPKGTLFGDVVTVDRVILDRAEKKRLALERHAVAVDMEGAAVGSVARMNGLPFLSIRAILDTPDEPLASSYESILKTMEETIVRPRTIVRLSMDAWRARRAARSLRKFFEHFLV